MLHSKLIIQQAVWFG